MKRLILFLFTILAFQITYAQIEQKPAEEYKERPYPVTNTPASEDAATFLTLFEDSEVGNMKVYAYPDNEMPEEYYFAGTEIPRYFHAFFDGEYQMILSNGAKAYATHSIKGNESEHFIIRIPTNKGENTLVLFELIGERLEPVQTLAYAFCENGTCYQLDSFVTDLDGDTDLDILMKKKKISSNRSGKAPAIKSGVLLQGDDGRYESAKVSSAKVDIDQDMYNMHETEF